jgi:hypothetical protein
LQPVETVVADDANGNQQVNFMPSRLTVMYNYVLIGSASLTALAVPVKDGIPMTTKIAL